MSPQKVKVEYRTKKNMRGGKIKKRIQEQSQHTKYTLQNAYTLLWVGHKFNSKL